MAKDTSCLVGYWDRFEKFGYLTSSEIELLNKSAKLLKIDSSEEFGIQVFENLFLLSPELKSPFSVAVDKELPGYLLAAHALQFSTMLTKLIQMLSRGDYIEYRETILKLGKLHSTLNIGIIGFQHFHTILFLSIQDMMGDDFTIAIQRVWLKLFDELMAALVEVEWDRQKAIVVNIDI